MTHSPIADVSEKLTRMKAVDAPLLKEVADAIRTVFKDTPTHPEVLNDPTEAAVHMIDKALPGWSISLSGQATEPDGHWTCLLRETEGRDNDEVIGFGSAPTVGLALLSALTKVAAQKSQS